MSKVVSPNMTSSFGLPLVGLLKRQLEPYFVNAYIFDDRLGNIEDSEFGKDHVFVLLRYQGTKHFKEVEDYLEGLVHFKAEYDLNGGTFVMYILEVLDTFKKDYELFKQGRYSEISKKGQQMIKKSVKPGGTAVKILRKDKSLKEYQEKQVGESIGEQEVWSIPKESEEIFSVDELQRIIHAYKMKGHAIS